MISKITSKISIIIILTVLSEGNVTPGCICPSLPVPAFTRGQYGQTGVNGGTNARVCLRMPADARMAERDPEFGADDSLMGINFIMILLHKRTCILHTFIHYTSHVGLHANTYILAHTNTQKYETTNRHIT